jgi:hypothetical protein
VHRHYARNDTSYDHLFLSYCALLDWWSAHLELVEHILTSR